MQPAEPALNVLSEPIEVGPLLVKPTGTFIEPIQPLLRRAQFATRVKAIAQEIKPSCCATDKPLIGVNLKFQVIQHRVHGGQRRPQLVPARRQDDPVIHEALVANPQALPQRLHDLVQGRQVERPKQR